MVETPDGHSNLRIFALGSGAVAIAVCGNLDGTSVAEILCQLSELAATGCYRVVVDLTDVESADSAGLAGLISGLEFMRAAGGDLRIAAPGPAVRTMMELASLDRVFEICKSADESF